MDIAKKKKEVQAKKDKDMRNFRELLEETTCNITMASIKTSRMEIDGGGGSLPNYL